MTRQALGLLMVIAACTAMGFRLSMDLNRRVNSLKELQKLMELLKGEIRYAAIPLEEAFVAMAGRCPEPFCSFFMRIAEEMEKRDGRTLAIILEENEKWLRVGTELKNSDIKAFVCAGGRLGYLDMEMQLRTIDVYLEELEKECAAAEEEYQGKGKVYRCLGFMSGLFLAVVFL